MIYFTTEKSAAYGARIFLQDATNANQTNEVVGLHELAKELSVWKGADKTVVIPPQDCARAWNKAGFLGGRGNIAMKAILKGYEMDTEELAVMEKRCKARGLVNITPILRDIQQEWV